MITKKIMDKLNNFMVDNNKRKNLKEYQQCEILRELDECIDLLNAARRFILYYDPSVCGTAEYEAIVRSVGAQLLRTLENAEMLERCI